MRWIELVPSSNRRRPAERARDSRRPSLWCSADSPRVECEAMGDGLARREVLLLVLTHALAFTVPVIPLIPAIRDIVRGAPGIQAFLAESYSARVAGFEVAAGDDRAAAAALRRHVDRLTRVPTQLVER